MLAGGQGTGERWSQEEPPVGVPGVPRLACQRSPI